MTTECNIFEPFDFFVSNISLEWLVISFPSEMYVGGGVASKRAPRFLRFSSASPESMENFGAIKDTAARFLVQQVAGSCDRSLL